VEARLQEEERDSPQHTKKKRGESQFHALSISLEGPVIQCSVRQEKKTPIRRKSPPPRKKGNSLTERAVSLVFSSEGGKPPSKPSEAGERRRKPQPLVHGFQKKEPRRLGKAIGTGKRYWEKEPNDGKKVKRPKRIRIR